MDDSKPIRRRSSDSSEHPSGDNRFAVVDKHLKRVRYAQDQLIETLHVAQGVFGFLDDDILTYVATALRLPHSEVLGVATFYQLFTFEPPGDHTCTVCTGTACFVKGANDIVDQVAGEFSVASGETTEDGALTLKTARCLGSCGLAPVVLLDGEVTSRGAPDSVVETLTQLMSTTAVASEGAVS